MKEKKQSMSDKKARKRWMIIVMCLIFIEIILLIFYVITTSWKVEHTKIIPIENTTEPNCIFAPEQNACICRFIAPESFSWCRHEFEKYYFNFGWIKSPIGN